MNTTAHSQRIVTALILLGIVSIAVLLGGWCVFIVTAIVALIGLGEFYDFFWAENEHRGLKWLGLLMGFLMLCFAAATKPLWVFGLVFLAFWIANFVLLLNTSPECRASSQSRYLKALILPIGLLYVPGALQFFLNFRPAEILFVLFAAVAADTGAFYFGQACGKRKIWPAVSPNKTWEGAAGGLLCTMFVVWLFGEFFGSGHASWGDWLILGLFLNLAAQVGDFFESALKRSHEIKDSGYILPGHGGVLDRIDGLLLVTFTFAACKSVYAYF